MKDPYLYDDVPVLKNKFGSKNQEELDKLESSISYARMLKIDELLTKDSVLDYDYIKSINKFVLGDIYEFAGKQRTISIEKAEDVLGGDTVRYASPKEIEKTVKKTIHSMEQIDWKKLNIDEKTKLFCKHITEIWKAHPFREGNTRTIMTYANHYATKNGFPLENKLLQENNRYVRKALVKAADGEYAEPQYLEKIVKDAMERKARELALSHSPTKSKTKKNVKKRDHGLER